jgi:hypothetical protein
MVVSLLVGGLTRPLCPRDCVVGRYGEARVDVCGELAGRLSPTLGDVRGFVNGAGWYIPYSDQPPRVSLISMSTYTVPVYCASHTCHRQDYCGHTVTCLCGTSQMCQYLSQALARQLTYRFTAEQLSIAPVGDLAWRNRVEGTDRDIVVGIHCCLRSCMQVYKEMWPCLASTSSESPGRRVEPLARYAELMRFCSAFPR